MINAVTAILYIFKDVSAVVSLLMIMRFVFLEKLRLNKTNICLFSALIIFNAVAGIFILKSRIADYDSIMDYISNIIYIFALFSLTYRAGKGRLILTVFVTVYTVDLIYALASSFTGASLIVEYTLNTVLFAAICFGVYCVCIKSEINILPGVFSEIPLWVYVILLFFELTCYYKEYGASVQWYKVMYIVSVAGIVMCLFYLFFRISRMAYMQNAVLNRMQQQKENYESRLADEEELRRFRHDYRNHMSVISSLLSDGKVEAAAEYTETLGSAISGNEKIARTGNLAADAVINHKYALAKTKDIEILFTGFIPSKCIEDVDICTVLSNLLDNAIEATDKCCTDRVIKIESALSNGHFLLTLTNPYTEALSEKNGKLKTTKQDKKNHGIGMKNVERTVEKYHGAIYVEYEHSVFTTNLRMKIKTAQK